MNPRIAQTPALQAPRRKRYFYSIIGLVVIGNLAVLVYLHLYRNSQQQANAVNTISSNTGEFSRFGVGEPMPVFEAENIRGGTLNSKDYLGKWLLVLYLGSKLNPGLLTYCQALFEQHRDVGLQPLAITTEPPETIRGLVTDEGISYPILSDNKNPLKDTFRLDGDGSCVFLVDPSGNVRFSVTHLPPQDSLRQLVERYISGSINYKASTSQSMRLKPGDRVPSYAIRDARTLAESSLGKLELNDASLILFGAECSSCQLSSYLNAVERASGNQNLGEKVYFVFNRNFSINEIADALNSRRIGSSVYVAKDNLEAFGNPYAIKSTYGEEAIAIATDRRGRVKTIRPLTEWLTTKEHDR